MKRLAIIPARGGSKRIPNKNISDFCGQPMITHVLSAARASGLFTTVHVSTESESIRDVAAQFGFPPDFLRPNKLADDHTPSCRCCVTRRRSTRVVALISTRSGC
jgi:N-acylneuraminate cytidylyltransferase